MQQPVLPRRLRHIAGFMTYLAGTSMVLMMLLTVVDVLGRALIPGFYLIGVIELSVISVILLGFFGLPRSFAAGEHISVDLVTFAAPKKLQDTLDALWLLLSGLVAGFFAFFVLKSGIELSRTGQVTEMLHISPLVHHSAGAAGLAVTVIVCLWAAVVQFRAVFASRSHDQSQEGGE